MKAKDELLVGLLRTIEELGRQPCEKEDANGLREVWSLLAAGRPAAAYTKYRSLDTAVREYVSEELALVIMSGSGVLHSDKLPSEVYATIRHGIIAREIRGILETVEELRDEAYDLGPVDEQTVADCLGLKVCICGSPVAVSKKIFYCDMPSGHNGKCSWRGIAAQPRKASRREH